MAPRIGTLVKAILAKIITAAAGRPLTGAMITTEAGRRRLPTTENVDTPAIRITIVTPRDGIAC